MESILEAVNAQIKAKKANEAAQKTGISGLGTSDEDLRTAALIEEAQGLTVVETPQEKKHPIKIVETVDKTNPPTIGAVNNLTETDKAGIAYVQRVNDAKS